MVIFFSIAATLRVHAVCKMNVAVQLQSLACIAGLLLATRLFLLSAEVGISAVYVRPSGLKDPSCSLVMVPASFS